MKVPRAFRDLLGDAAAGQGRLESKGISREKRSGSSSSGGAALGTGVEGQAGAAGGAGKREVEGKRRRREGGAAVEEEEGEGKRVRQSDEGGERGDAVAQEAWMVLFQAARAARHGFELVSWWEAVGAL